MQHKREAFWFYRYLSIFYDKLVNPLFWTEPMRDKSLSIGRLDEAGAVMEQFGRFDRHGTIPNMIRGDDTGNRDTSDAPLWLLRVADELAAARKDLDAWLAANAARYYDAMRDTPIGIDLSPVFVGIRATTPELDPYHWDMQVYNRGEEFLEIEDMVKTHPDFIAACDI